MSWSKYKNLTLKEFKDHQKELSRNSSKTYYYKNRLEILQKRHKRYIETGN